MEIIDTTDLRDPGPAGAIKDGKLQILPAAFWREYRPVEIFAFCVRQACYCLPTTELVDWLKENLGPDAIEIGSGNGILAEALGIPATDNKMQEGGDQYSDVLDYYKALGQPLIKYGENVEKLDALEAIRKYKPKTVLGAWVTHKWSPAEPWREGSIYGIDEREVIRQARYVFVGNLYVHKGKPLLNVRPERIEPSPWLYSRTRAQDLNFIGVWEKQP